MKVEYSKAFVKAVRKLSGKMLDSVRNAIQEVIEARCIDEITDCKKLVGYDFVYRIRIGSYRAFCQGGKRMIRRIRRNCTI